MGHALFPPLLFSMKIAIICLPSLLLLLISIVNHVNCGANLAAQIEEARKAPLPDQDDEDWFNEDVQPESSEEEWTASEENAYRCPKCGSPVSNESFDQWLRSHDHRSPMMGRLFSQQIREAFAVRNVFF